MSTQLFRSVCPYDCPDACGLIVSVANGRVVKVSGDAGHPFTQGALCPKMTHYERTVYSPERLQTPLLRSGPKGKGKFRPLPWPEAIKLIASRWQEIIAAHGTEAILPYSYAGTMGLLQRNAGHAFFHRLGASRLNRTICASAQDYGWSAVMGNTPGPRPQEAADSDLIILWGINALATNIHFLNVVRQAKKRGATVWLIDTYETPTAKAADRTFLLRPGSDGALALGIMHVLMRDGLIDKKFIETSVQGYDQLAAKILPRYSPEAAGRITGIDPVVIEEIALAYAAAQAPFIRLGSGLSRYGNGAMTIRTICCLPALTGAWTKPGGGLLAGISTGSAFKTEQITREDLLPFSPRTVNMNQLGDALNNLDHPRIMSLYVYNSNPAAVAPDQNQVLAGLAREDLFTVVHERFMTDTALYADIILPATTSLEHADLYRAYGHYGVQYAQPVIEPIGEAKPNWEVFQLLAKEMGFTEDIFTQPTTELISSLLDDPSHWLAQADITQLRKGLPVELPVAKNYKTVFQTPSGKIEILNPAEKEPLPFYFEPYGDNAPFWLVSAPSLTLLNSSFNERRDLAADQMILKMHPDDAAAKKLTDASRVVVFNERGEAFFTLQKTTQVPRGVVVTEGILRIQNAFGGKTVNVLTSQRLTDQAEGSTFYDTKVDVRPYEPNPWP